MLCEAAQRIENGQRIEQGKVLELRVVLHHLRVKIEEQPLVQRLARLPNQPALNELSSRGVKALVKLRHQRFC